MEWINVWTVPVLIGLVSTLASVAVYFAVMVKRAKLQEKMWRTRYELMYAFFNDSGNETASN